MTTIAHETDTARPETDQPSSQPAKLCQYGGAFCPPAEVFDLDGCWCTPEHRQYDRQSESTQLRRWL